ncbi:MAG: polysaccharide deacetylase family protein [Chloroflexi bacterium]|nr:polysaccharide deacetylase family protein [Chloroflexota bacterium]
MKPHRHPGSSRERVALLRAARRRRSSPQRYLIPGAILIALAVIAIARIMSPGAASPFPGAPTAAVRQATPAGVPLTPELALLPTVAPATAPASVAGSLAAVPTAVPGSVTRMPILMYHYVREVDGGTDPLGYGLSVTPANFAAQLDALARLGYAPVRMDQALACLQGVPGCPRRPVALTFDDGYADAASVVLPLLRERGFVATFYVVADFIGQPGYLTVDEVRMLAASGMEIGAHSVTHLDLTTLDEATARYEIAESRQRIAALTEQPVTSFCYPAGRFNAAVRALVQEAGFSTAVTTIQNADFADLLALPRLRIDGATDLAGFEWLVHSLEQ